MATENPLPESEIQESTGYIGFFDILGYRSFLKAEGTPKQATKEVLKVISFLKNTVPQIVLEVVGTIQGNLQEKLQWLIFSDTILIAAPTNEEDQNEKAMILLVLTATIMEMQRFMFDYGLPLRGAVTYGDFILHGTTFAGSSIVRAYELSNNLDLAACVVAQEVIEAEPQYMFEDGKKRHLFTKSQHVFNYHVPLKLNSSADYAVIFPSIHKAPERPSWHDKDIAQLVAESFWKHGKKINSAVLSKLKNTELLLRFFKMCTEADGRDFK